MNTRLNPVDRKHQILEKAMELAHESHYMLVTQSEIAKALNISPSLVLTYFGTMDNLRYSMILKAMGNRDQTLLAQASHVGYKLAHTVPRGI